MATENSLDNWLSSWPDLVAFIVGLAVAWWAGWTAGDLVWSLWLSSLVVGYATIVWIIGQPAMAIARAAWSDRALVEARGSSLTLFWVLWLAGVLFVLGFFTIHFGGFHYVHSQIMIAFFPIDAGDGSRPLDVGMSTYIEIARRYWLFLPSAFLAHRAAFMRKPLLIVGGESGGKIPSSDKLSALFTDPYRTVVRMHILLFFFFFAHFAGLENFAVYAVVYAAYFFPWRLVRRAPIEAASVAPH